MPGPATMLVSAGDRRAARGHQRAHPRRARRGHRQGEEGRSSM